MIVITAKNEVLIKNLFFNSNNNIFEFIKKFNHVHLEEKTLATIAGRSC